MSKKISKETVTKTYGSSWYFTILLAVVIGFIGAIIGNSTSVNNGMLLGFLVGVVMAILGEIVVLVNVIPFAGLPLYIIYMPKIFGWLINISGFSGTAFLTLSLLPFWIFLIFGAIIYCVVTVIATVVIGAGLGAIFG
jgi:hypothetical protein